MYKHKVLHLNVHKIGKAYFTLLYAHMSEYMKGYMYASKHTCKAECPVNETAHDFLIHMCMCMY